MEANMQTDARTDTGATPAAPGEAPKPGSNIGAVKKEIAELADQVIALRISRGEINAEIAAKRARVEELGIKKRAFDYAVKYKEMDIDQRRELDTSYAIAREAVGVPIEAGLFGDD
tara:strand:+ start:404 stop:751 length:348 start_codon:yes stop_codon:yes gene_type:complete